MHPEPGGAVVLRVNIRSTETIQWYKNGIALKEGADGGRVKGVTTNTLTFGKLLPRDQGVKVWAAGKNKWGSVETTPCELMVRPPHCAPLPTHALARGGLQSQFEPTGGAATHSSHSHPRDDPHLLHTSTLLISPVLFHLAQYTKIDDLKVTDHPRVSAPERKEMLDSMLEASKSFKMGTLKSFKKGGSQGRDRGPSGVSPGGSMASSGSLSRGQSISFNASL